MSTKSTIVLTSDNEHWYTDSSEPLLKEPHKDAITLEFSKRNIRVDLNDDEDIVITVTNPNCQIYKLLSGLVKKITTPIVSNQKELLIAFFMYFRENGGKNIGMTIEQFVDDFLSS